MQRPPTNRHDAERTKQDAAYLRLNAAATALTPFCDAGFPSPTTGLRLVDLQVVRLGSDLLINGGGVGGAPTPVANAKEPACSRA